MTGPIVLSLLAACSAPSRHFQGIEPTRVTVEGSVFDVRVRGRLAESIRVNSQYAPRFGAIEKRAAVAMASVSGCEVVGVLGDQSVQVGQLDCGGGASSASPITVPPNYDCTETPSGITAADGWEYVDFDCTPYWR